MPASDQKLVDSLAKWMLTEHARFHELKRVPSKQRRAISARAKTILEKARKRKFLRVFESGGRPLAIVVLQPSLNPRIARQQSLFFMYEARARKQVMPWLAQTLTELSAQAPRYTQIGLTAPEEKWLRKPLELSGFNTRYEILMGDTKVALENLIRKKSPSRDLSYLDLGLELKDIDSPNRLREAMHLQKRISLQSKKHGYFSHTDSQLKEDEAQYNRIITGKMQGRLLGVYRGTKILGLMMTGVHAHPSSPQKTGGFSLFLDRSIQGKGVTKTGYLLLLEYLREKRIRKFYGGTSQPAIQGLGKIMKRQVQHIIFVKM